ncbi:MAG: peptidoglycan DD-metalloendopeptidase family protein [Legionella sp.]|nr:peptidoglycan DD-metalloendopeptidase family protein [Legionella sp.]
MNIYLILCLAYISLFINSYAASPKIQLNQLETQMLNIKKQLSEDESTQEKRYQTLAKTEKKISTDLHALHQLTHEEAQTKTAINALEKRIETLNQALEAQEKILANHIRSRHRLGAVHPWKWLVHQETPRTLSRLFVFYQYLFQADEQLIQHLRKTSNALKNQQRILSDKQTKLKNLQEKLKLRQTRLTRMKQEQHDLIHTLSQKIQTKHERLKTFHNDKMRLQALIKKLNLRPRKLRASPTLNLGGKALKTPLNIASKTKSLNQGLVFLAHEGTSVIAVLPGKVIFSDWLKGYGLLLIIDHGNDILSLYAHNASLFKPLGASVKQGEQIATVGHTGGLRENGLYFEVRRRGRAVPPREWMS